MERQARASEEESRPFLFLGGHLALDVVNTVVVEGGELTDRLSAPEELARWVRASPLGREFGAPAELAPSVFAQVIGLRGALKAGFDAVVEERPVPEATLATMNAILRSAPGSELRRSVEAAAAWAIRCASTSAEDATPLPWLLADAGADLMAGGGMSRLRRCANRGTCVLMFLDTSRSHTRRWCSMDLCGNRSKVAAHSARTRQRPRT